MATDNQNSNEQSRKTELASILNFEEDRNKAVLANPEIEATIDGKTVLGSAEVRLDLLPQPNMYVYCELDISDDPAVGLRVPFDSKLVSTLTVDGKELDGFAVQPKYMASDGGKLSLRWCPHSEPADGRGNQYTQMERVLAHIFNLIVLDMPPRKTAQETNGRVVEEIDLRSSMWNVRLTAIEKTDEIRESLRTQGGSFFTHVAELSKADNSSFSGQEADDLLDGFRLFLCLVLGSDCRAVCPAGFDALGNCVWSKWSSPRLWEGNVVSWFHGPDPSPLIALFPGYVQRWGSEKWREAFREAISWYVSANQSSRGIDGGIIFAQSAVERLAYEYCVCEKVYVRTKGFRALPAADKYRLLLSSLSIPLEIPIEATSLLAAAKANTWEDGPQALTELRNDLVHGGKKRSNWSFDCYIEAWKLSLWYVEMVLLALCGYQGFHWNRNKREVDAVPW